METLISFLAKFLVILSAAVVVGKVVYFNFFVAPTLNKILDPQNRVKVTGALFPRYYYLGIACGILILLAATQLQMQFDRWVAIPAGFVIIAASAVCRFFFLPKLNGLKSVIEQMPPVEQKRSREQKEWKRLQKIALRLNLLILIAGLILIARMS